MVLGKANAVIEAVMQDAKFDAYLSRPSCSVAQAAEMLGMSRQGILNAIERGDIGAVRIGKRVVVPTAPLRRILMIDASSLPPAA